MTEIVVVRIRSFLIRGLAVLALIGTYALSGVGTQVLTSVGLSSLMVASTATPAEARHWRRRYWW